MTAPVTVYLQPSELGTYGIHKDAWQRIPIADVVNVIASSCRRFDSYIRGRVDFPLVQIGEDVKECVAVLAAYTLMSVRGWSGDGAGDEKLVARWEAMVAWLELIANGKAFPDVTGSGAGDSSGRPTARPRAYSSGQQGWSTRGTNNLRGPFTNR